MKPKINFFCIGAQKAGTTTLYDILKQHPDIYLPEDKEAPFFAYPDWYAKGEEWFYKTHFSKYKGEKIVGTITPDYFLYPYVPARILNSVGENIKFIVILRNPVERAISHYNMTNARLLENFNFLDALKNEKNRITNIKNKDLMHFSYVTRGLYHEQISRWLKYFPIENFLFIDFEKEFTNNTDKTINKILYFLKIEQITLDTKIHSFEAWEYKYRWLKDSSFLKSRFGKKLRKIMPYQVKNIFNKKIKARNKLRLSKTKKKQILQDYFLDDIKKLEKLLNRDFSHWLYI